MAKRYFLQFSYNGTGYAGWQIQPNALTVQEVLNQKISMILREEISTVGAGRTDTGVHAKEMFCHFDINNADIKTESFLNTLNKVLPFDIAVSNLIRVSNKAHARFDALSRTYEYYITIKKDPFLIDKANFIPHILDINKMNEAAKILLNHKDFGAFSKSNTQVFTNNCDIAEASWRKEENLIVFKIKANRFLRNMVRAIVGTLLEVGKSQLGINEFEKIILSKNRSNAGESVAACGLYLVNIEYDWNKLTSEI